MVIRALVDIDLAKEHLNLGNRLGSRAEGYISYWVFCMSLPPPAA